MRWRGCWACSTDEDRAGASEHGDLRVATAEDLIVLKAIANRAKDQGDLAGLTKLQNLDWAYIDAAAKEWGEGVVRAIAHHRGQA
jgi:hypothetical protein